MEREEALAVPRDMAAGEREWEGAPRASWLDRPSGLGRLEKPLICLAVVAVFPLYIWTNFQTNSRPPEALLDLTTPIDRAFPFHPGWEWIYSLVFLSVFLPVCAVKHHGLFRRIALSYVLMLFVALAVFWAFPSRFPRPAYGAEGSFAEWGVKLNFFCDPPNNCFPSLHVASSFLAALIVFKVDRVPGAIALSFATAVAVSTMGVKQHWLADILGGVALAALAYSLLVRPFDAAGLPAEALRRSRGAYAVFGAVYALLLAFLYAAYRAGFRPWAA